jgi:hypothetical protein
MNANNIINNTKKVNVLREIFRRFFALGMEIISPHSGELKPDLSKQFLGWD